MKRINLKEGFLVYRWDGEIIPITYAEIEHREYGNDEKKWLVLTRDGVSLGFLTKYGDGKVFDNLEAARSHAESLREKRIEYYEKEIIIYKENIKELKTATL